MATKTVTVEVDAYAKLVEARQDPKESFSSVVRRARWHEEPATAGALLESLEELVAKEPGILLDDATLARMSERPLPVRTSAWAEN